MDMTFHRRVTCNPHRPPRLHHARWRCGIDVAARGVGAAAGDAHDRPEAVANRLRGLRHGLKESGYIENEKLAIAYRCSEGQSERLPGLAAFHDPLRFHLHS